MSLYEFVLRVPGRPDEVRISDYNGLCEGDEITIANRRWIVVAKEPAVIERPDRLPVQERIVVAHGAAASGRVLVQRDQIPPTAEVEPGEERRVRATFGPQLGETSFSFVD